MGADNSKRIAVVMSWSGGKDSALALHELRSDPRYEVVALMTSVSEEFRRVSHHGVREELLEAQAEAIGVPLTKIYLPSGSNAPCTNEVYEEIMARAMEDFKSRGVFAVGFGDLFLEDLRAWRENNLAKAGMTGVFPIWKRDTANCRGSSSRWGSRPSSHAWKGKSGQGSWGGRTTSACSQDLPEGIDPCGEYGEFHSFVYDGPGFGRPVAVKVGETVSRDGRYYADLLLVERAAAASCTAGDIPPV